MKQYLNYGLEILTICQAVWVLTLIIFLMWHYMNKSIKNRVLEKSALAMGFSYSLLTVCTMITSLKGVYDYNDLWQIILFVGYVFGDYAILRMLKHTTKNEKTKKVLKQYINDNS